MSIEKYEGPLDKPTLTKIIMKSKESISQSITKIGNKAIKESVDSLSSRLLSAPMRGLVTNAQVYVTGLKNGPEVPSNFPGLNFKYFGRPMDSRT